mmetsp:Transcript_27116/g.42417  ORF Transcript_27116/g.42417 Transcript_27116/m.42417 type:complete len:581 (+) Transcript_27116:385-2127(+)
MLLEKPTRVYEDEEESWLLVETNRAFRLQKYKYGGIGKGIRTIQSILTMAKIVHRSPSRGTTADIPWDYRVVSLVPVPYHRGIAAAVGKHSADGTRDNIGHEQPQKREEVAHCWQLAGSNNLFHARKDMEALVTKLNSLLTDMELPNLKSSSESEYWQEGSHTAVLSLLASMSSALKEQNPERRPSISHSERSFEHEVDLYTPPSAADLFTAASSDWSDIMILVIFVVLTPSELLKCAQVCRSWNRMASHDALWQGHLHHLNQTLGIVNVELMDQLVGKMVVDGMITYKYLYSATFIEAVRRRNCQVEGDKASAFLGNGLHDVGEHDMRRVVFKGLYGVTNSMGGGLKELRQGIQEAGSGMATGAVGGLLIGGEMAARMGNATPGPAVTRRALSVGGGLLGVVGGAVTGTIVGAATAVPSVLRGCVARPFGGLADLLHETGNMIRNVPEEIMGTTGHEFSISAEEDDVACRHTGGVGAGISSGLQTLQREVGDGVGSLYSDPVQGAEDSGMEGILVGGGKGALKAVCKPMAGTILFSGAVARGISNSVDKPTFSWSGDDEGEYKDVREQTPDVPSDPGSG